MKMNYLVLGTNDRPAAAEFYNKLLADQNVEPVYEGERMTLWQGEDFLFAVADPFDGNPATVGNGSMLGMQLDSADAVTLLHARALDLGGSDEGEPRERSGRFSAYVRDPDGNKLCFYE